VTTIISVRRLNWNRRRLEGWSCGWSLIRPLSAVTHCIATQGELCED
jgi:hypothetical protein